MLSFPQRVRQTGPYEETYTHAKPCLLPLDCLHLTKLVHGRRYCSCLQHATPQWIPQWTQQQNKQCPLQVATDTRLWLMHKLDDIRGSLADLLRASVARAEQDVDVLMPGFTHLQPAMTVRWSHWLLGHAAAWQRDDMRLRDLMPRVAMLPLGSGTAFMPCPVASSDCHGIQIGIMWLQKQRGVSAGACCWRLSRLPSLVLGSPAQNVCEFYQQQICAQDLGISRPSSLEASAQNLMPL